MGERLPFKIIGVAGVKGGVGKSSSSLALALMLKDHGAKVGFLDADVDSPFAAEVLGLHGKIGLDKTRRMVPTKYRDVPVMSFAAWIPDEFSGSSMPGSMHSQWLDDALQFTEWGDIDILVADLPAGSSDAWLTVRRMAGDRFVGLVAVALSNLVTSLQRLWNIASRSNTRIIGVVENMSGPVFGEGKVEEFCLKHGLRFFGTIPLDPRIRERHDRHEPSLPEDLAGPIRLAADTVLTTAGIKAVAK